eukprot:TRINITY_DN15451_c0_g1_i4.p1 TRINITY_DN15451_c0_g1~~TRINITY_DN15451_c0_g1_i4.p1  ORF type:complete len:459 (-),score=67.86 TRINITY_DN15451_c0_g1_i4:344-1720(-)
MAPWCCSVCTYKHLGAEVTFLACAVCGHPRRPSAKVVDACTKYACDQLANRKSTEASKHEDLQCQRHATSQECARANQTHVSSDHYDSEVATAFLRPTSCYSGSTSPIEGLHVKQISRGRSSLEISMKGRGLNDDAVFSWCHAARRELMPIIKTAAIAPFATMVNFAENRIGSRGLEAIFQLLRDLKIGVRVFQLHRNLLDDAAAEVMARYIIECPQAIEELHLSHNQITQEGALMLIEAFMKAGKRGSPMYPPWDSRGRFRPVWLRLEFNWLQRGYELCSHLLEDRYRSIRSSCGFRFEEGVALICGVPSNCGCKSGMCSVQQEALGPVVHLPHMGKGTSMQPAPAWRTGFPPATGKGFSELSEEESSDEEYQKPQPPSEAPPPENRHFRPPPPPIPDRFQATTSRRGGYAVPGDFRSDQPHVSDVPLPSFRSSQQIYSMQGSQDDEEEDHRPRYFV